MFLNKHVRGEWYKFDESDLEYIQRYIEETSSNSIFIHQQTKMEI